MARELKDDLGGAVSETMATLMAHMTPDQRAAAAEDLCVLPGEWAWFYRAIANEVNRFDSEAAIAQLELVESFRRSAAS